MASTRVAQTASSGSSARGVAYWGYSTQKVAKSESAEGVANTAVAPSDSKESAEVGTSSGSAEGVGNTMAKGVNTEVANPGLGLTWESF